MSVETNNNNNKHNNKHNNDNNNNNNNNNNNSNNNNVIFVFQETSIVPDDSQPDTQIGKIKIKQESLKKEVNKVRNATCRPSYISSFIFRLHFVPWHLV